MATTIVFSPLVDWALIAGLGLAGLASIVLALARRSPPLGLALRLAGFALILGALANPVLLEELRDPRPDVAVLVVDESSSQSVRDRRAQTAEAAEALSAELKALAEAGDGAPTLEVREIRVGDGGGPIRASRDDTGTRLLTALSNELEDVDPDRIAGAILVTDGQSHDADRMSEFPGPVHTVLTGEPGEFDRRLALDSAPAFGLVGEEVIVTAHVEELGAPAPDGSRLVDLRVSIDGVEVDDKISRVGDAIEISIEIAHGGPNVVELTAVPRPGELTDRNNSAVFSVNGVRDRLRVLLVSGEPHPGERTWRNLLKADPSVDLVHFTILRPPAKQDGVPVRELSLIAFPTRELFQEKIGEFDLIIFDRYRRRGVLPTTYLRNISQYVRDGGAVLVASGPSFAGVESLARTPLVEISPVRPTTDVIVEGFTPLISEKGARHPVTAGLERLAPRPPEDGVPGWGRWFRLIDMTPISGRTLMSGPSEKPLLVLDRVEEGRVAVLASDHAWLWTRGFEGGGPQAELLRRLAHWLMKEPELEEDALIVEVDGARVSILRRSVDETPTEVEVESPSGASEILPLVEVGPGAWRATYEAEEQGLHRFYSDALTAVAAVGPPAPKEYENPVASPDPMAHLVAATKGSSVWLSEEGVPNIRRIREGRSADGRGWVGLWRREAYTVRDVSLSPLAPAWVVMLLAGLLLVGAWRVEGR